MCPTCYKAYDRRLIRRTVNGYTCPDIHCSGYMEMRMVEPDIILEPIIRKLHEKGWYTKYQKDISQSGRLDRETRTLIEFSDDFGVPYETSPEGFVWEGNVLSSSFSETYDMNNIRRLAEWVDTLLPNEFDDPAQYPCDYAEWYEMKETSEDN